MPKYRCRARNDHGKGTLCQNRVKEPGQRCHLHKGEPEAPPRQRNQRGRTTARPGSSKPRPSTSRHRPSPQQGRASGNDRRRLDLQESGFGGTRGQTSSQQAKSTAARKAAAEEARRKKRVEEAESFCVDILTDGWKKAVEAKISDYVTKQAFQQLSRGRHRKTCRSLAKFATEVLKGKKWLHDVVGSIARWIVSLLTGNWAVQIFARKLAAKIPLPWDTKIIAVARGIQIVGIFLCVVDGRELTRCQCFIDLAIEETKTRVKEMLATALDDWEKLANFPFNQQPGARK
jgi:hypothetical protein